MEIMKQTDEIRVETEEEAKALLEDFKQKALENGYEIASYSATHKVKKDDDFYICKIIKVW
jgi:hypothetical protein